MYVATQEAHSRRATFCFCPSSVFSFLLLLRFPRTISPPCDAPLSGRPVNLAPEIPEHRLASSSRPMCLSKGAAGRLPPPSKYHHGDSLATKLSGSKRARAPPVKVLLTTDRRQARRCVRAYLCGLPRIRRRPFRHDMCVLCYEWHLRPCFSTWLTSGIPGKSWNQQIRRLRWGSTSVQVGLQRDHPIRTQEHNPKRDVLSRTACRNPARHG